MTVMGKISALALASGMIVAMISPSLAAEYEVTKIGGTCFVVEKGAAKDEQRVAGPYATSAEAEKAKAENENCVKPNN